MCGIVANDWPANQLRPRVIDDFELHDIPDNPAATGGEPDAKHYPGLEVLLVFCFVAELVHEPLNSQALVRVARQCHADRVGAGDQISTGQ